MLTIQPQSSYSSWYHKLHRYLRWVDTQKYSFTAATAWYICVIILLSHPDATDTDDVITYMPSLLLSSEFKHTKETHRKHTNLNLWNVSKHITSQEIKLNFTRMCINSDRLGRCFDQWAHTNENTYIYCINHNLHFRIHSRKCFIMPGPAILVWKRWVSYESLTAFTVLRKLRPAVLLSSCIISMTACPLDSTPFAGPNNQRNYYVGKTCG